MTTITPELPDEPVVVIITTVATTLQTFLSRHVALAIKRGFKIVAISSPSAELTDFGQASGARVYGIDMVRRVDIISDLRALWKLFVLLRRIRPEIVHTHTPKAGLLGMIAALCTGVPVRIYTVNGLVAAARRGLFRTVLMTCEMVSCRLATHVFCVSPSIRRALVRLGIVTANKGIVIGSGASHGVNLAAFDSRRFPPEVRLAIRRELGVPAQALVAGFVGRFVRDKGILELLDAWPNIRSEVPNAFLLLCGSEDTDDETWRKVAASCSDPSIRQISVARENMPRVCAALDVGVLPSYREGLPNVLLEFAAMDVPIVATRVLGCIDVVNHRRAVMIPARNTRALRDAVVGIMKDAPRRAQISAVAREYVSSRFSEDLVCSKVIEAYSICREQVRSGPNSTLRHLPQLTRHGSRGH